VAHLKVRDVDKPYGIKQIQFGLNDNLPADINISKVETAFGDFNARHDATARYYVYQISTRRTAFAKPFVWWVKDRLNVDAMRECCRSIIGKHDFFSFSEIDNKQSSTMVKVENCELMIAGDLILFRIGASHFLWKMVRRIVGALVEVGRGKLSVYEFEQLLNKPSRITAAWTAPPSGLFLEKVLYQDEQITELKPLFPVR
ncbi:MAG: tRNA pseudouridine(38-40) synthase TruA, partial [Pyrinomonadaceae bacterium]|nr:tRNA pseudouridine(38-40) synthase TruA [Pyrinomonadaceae bacterium]